MKRSNDDRNVAFDGRIRNLYSFMLPGFPGPSNLRQPPHCRCRNTGNVKTAEFECRGSLATSCRKSLFPNGIHITVPHVVFPKDTPNNSRTFWNEKCGKKTAEKYHRVIHKNARGKNQTRRPKFFGMEQVSIKIKKHIGIDNEGFNEDKVQNGKADVCHSGLSTSLHEKWSLRACSENACCPSKQNFFDTVTSNKVFTHGCFIASSCLKLCILHKGIHRQCMAM